MVQLSIGAAALAASTALIVVAVHKLAAVLALPPCQFK